MTKTEYIIAQNLAHTWAAVLALREIEPDSKYGFDKIAINQIQATLLALYQKALLLVEIEVK